MSFLNTLDFERARFATRRERQTATRTTHASGRPVHGLFNERVLGHETRTSWVWT